MPEKPSYEAQQPATETLDYTMYQRIRREGAWPFARDGVCVRVNGWDWTSTHAGSPNVKHANEWTRDQFAAMGCSNAHLEDWGEFGMGWQQLNTWVRMASPDTAVFAIAQGARWSPSTNGAVTGLAVWIDVKKAEDVDKYKGKLGGKIVLYGDMHDVKPLEKPLFDREDEKSLAKIVEHPLSDEDRPYASYKQDDLKRRELEQEGY